MKPTIDEMTAHVRFLREQGGASSGYTADLLEGAAAQISASHEVIGELADDLIQHIKDHYGGTQEKYPDQRRRYERDIAPIRRARKWLSEQDGQG
jgi:hypothetical protein